MYRAATDFVDLQDNHYRYRKGDTFPRAGLSVGPERIRQLSGTENRSGIPLIVAAGEAETTEQEKTGKQAAPFEPKAAKADRARRATGKKGR